MNTRFCIVSVLIFGFALLTGDAGEPAKPKFNVKISDDKTVVVDVEDSGAIDPTQRINFGGEQFGNGFYMNIRTIKNETLHLSHFPTFLVNGQFIQANNVVVKQPKPASLPKTPGGRARIGYSTTQNVNNLRITQTLELHPSKAAKPGEKRLMNNVLIVHAIENPTATPINFGMRIYMDTYVINNDGCLFAAPVTHPGKILDGVVLQDKTLPPYLQMLQRPDLNNPGYMSHLSLNVGSKYERPTSSSALATAGFGGCEMPAMQAMFDSAIGLYFETKVKPGGKRDAYVYGEGIAVAAEAEGRFQRR